MIRVLRVLEYRYDDFQTMANDMRHWGVGANAVVTPNTHMSISSSTHLPEAEVGKYLDLDQHIQNEAARLKSGEAEPDARFMVKVDGEHRAVRTVDGIQHWSDVPEGAEVIEITEYVRAAAGVS